MKYFIPALLLLTAACAFRTSSSQNDDWKQRLRAGEGIFIENQVFAEDLDFTEILSANPIAYRANQVKTSASITFKNCIFRGKVMAFQQQSEEQITLMTFLSNVSFIDCEFREEVSFRASTIFGRADFTDSRFFAKASFEECSFYQNAFFNSCAFYNEVRFQNTFFGQKANFMQTQFDKTAFFQSATFQGELQFSVAEFHQYADFSLLHCEQNCFFNYTQFNDQATFNDAHFAKGADFNNTIFDKGIFRNCAFMGQTRFLKSSVNDTVDFENSFFLFGRPDFESFEAEKINLTNIRD